MSTQKSDSIKGWIVAILLVLAVIALVLSLNWYFIHNDVENRGTFGDMFGAANALFSGLAFAGVIIAIMLQRKELSLQREELELTRVVLEDQRSELQYQNQTLANQRFENTFFELLSRQGEVVNALSLTRYGQQPLVGRACFQSLYNEFTDVSWSDKANGSEVEKIAAAYEAFDRENSEDLGHYFRSLYHLIKLIDQSNVENKRLYTNLVRAQLSRYELLFLFYNCLTDKGRDKFKPLIEKYTLFKTLPQDLLIDPEKHPKLYAESAYA